MSAVSFLLWLLILAVVFGLLYWAIGLLPLPQPARNIALVILAVLLILILLGALFGGLPLPAFRL